MVETCNGEGDGLGVGGGTLSGPGSVRSGMGGAGTANGGNGVESGNVDWDRDLYDIHDGDGYICFASIPPVTPDPQNNSVRFSKLFVFLRKT